MPDIYVDRAVTDTPAATGTLNAVIEIYPRNI